MRRLVVIRTGDADLFGAQRRRPAPVASAIPSAGGIYLANEALGADPQAMNHVVRLKWPAQVQRPQ